jgi:hypothetical protein
MRAARPLTIPFGFLVLLSVLGALTSACSKSKASYFDGDQAKKAVAAVAAMLGEDPKAMRVEVVATRVLVRAPDPKDATKLVQFVHEGGALGAPQPVKATGGADGAFSLASVDFGLVPILAEEAKRKLGRAIREIRLVAPVIRRPDLPLTWTLETDGEGIALASLDGKEIRVEKQPR